MNAHLEASGTTLKMRKGWPDFHYKPKCCYVFTPNWNTTASQVAFSDGSCNSVRLRVFTDLRSSIGLMGSFFHKNDLGKIHLSFNSLR